MDASAPAEASAPEVGAEPSQQPASRQRSGEEPAQSSVAKEEPEADSARPAKRARVDEDATMGEATTADAAATGTVDAASTASTSAPATEPAALNPQSLAYRMAHFSANSETSSEALVGITAYVNPDLPPFTSAIIKHRFTDFLVWEISKDGEVVRLKDISRPIAAPLPSEEKEQKEQQGVASTSERAEDASDATKLQSEPKPEPAGPPTLESLLSAEKLKELDEFVKNGKQKGAEMQSDPIKDKEQRKAFHNAVREAHSGKLSTEAKEDGSIRISWSNGGGRDRRTTRPPKADQRSLPPYIRFTLHKTNRETQDCISQLASRIGVAPKDLATAGTKDKRGVTTQHVTVRRGRRTVEELWDQVNGLHHGRSESAFTRGGGRGGCSGRGGGRGGGGFMGREGMMPRERGDRGLRIGDLQYVDKPLDLGMLDGNRFGIVLRDVQAPSMDVITSALTTLRSTGFINFYGMQRFGNSSVPTHLVGLALLRTEWKEAARLILHPRDGDSPDIIEARKLWTEKRDARRALDQLPRWLVGERCLLEHYVRHGDSNQMAALSTIPKNLRMMYVHAYQSYLWNSVTSERVRLYGCNAPVAGDLVFDMEAPAPAEASALSGKITQDSVKAHGTSKTPKVRVLTQEEAESGKYTIHDVVLPLPGYSITYPGGQLGAMYREMMAADGLDADNMFRTQKEFSLGGAYRKIVLRPSNLTWELLPYTDPNADLTQPDEDALLGMPAPVPDSDGPLLALRLDFGLDTAAYATMALREVLKSETGNVEQRKMTEAMLDKVAAARGGSDTRDDNKKDENGEHAQTADEASVQSNEPASDIPADVAEPSQ